MQAPSCPEPTEGDSELQLTLEGVMVPKENGRHAPDERDSRPAVIEEGGAEKLAPWPQVNNPAFTFTNLEAKTPEICSPDPFRLNPVPDENGWVIDDRVTSG